MSYTCTTCPYVFYERKNKRNDLFYQKNEEENLNFYFLGTDGFIYNLAMYNVQFVFPP